MTQVSSIACIQTYIKIGINFVLPLCPYQAGGTGTRGVVLPLIIPNMVGSLVPCAQTIYLYAMHTRPTIYTITMLVFLVSTNFLQVTYTVFCLSGRIGSCFFRTPCAWCALLISLLKIAWSKV
jgi:hypothetical protein